MPTSTTLTAHRLRPGSARLLRPALIGLAAALTTLALSFAPTVAAADHGEDRSTESRSTPRQPGQLVLATGSGTVSGELPFCFNGAPGPCGPIVEGDVEAGQPIRTGTFFALIDNGGVATPRCVPARYSGLVQETPDDVIAQTGDGRLCPTGGGGSVFTGRVDITGVSGRFADLGTGRGRVVMIINANGHARLALTGYVRTS